MTNAARLWMELGLNQRQQLQKVLFPEGLRFDGEKFGTAVTAPVFSYLQQITSTEDNMVSPTGFEPVLPA